MAPKLERKKSTIRTESLPMSVTGTLPTASRSSAGDFSPNLLCLRMLLHLFADKGTDRETLLFLAVAGDDFEEPRSACRRVALKQALSGAALSLLVRVRHYTGAQ